MVKDIILQAEGKKGVVRCFLAHTIAETHAAGENVEQLPVNFIKTPRRKRLNFILSFTQNGQ